MLDHTQDDYLQIQSFLSSQTNVAKGQAWGKVMLFGEYAVLEGASALLTATPHQAKAHFISFDHLSAVESLIPELSNLDEQVDLSLFQAHYIIIAFQLGISLLVKTKDNGFKTFGQSFKFVEQCLINATAPKGIYFIDTQAFGLRINEQWQKMGIGSSGAASSAVCDLLAQLPEVPIRKSLCDPKKRFLYTHKQHQSVQGGLGSGADVACSTFGGLIEFKLHPNTHPEIRRLTTDLPRTWGLWKGGSFSTSHSLALLKQWKVQNPITYKQQVSSLAQASKKAVDLFTCSETNRVSQDSWCEVIDYAAEAMRNFSAKLNLPLWTDTHQNWSKLVAKHSGVIKSTGAGGDDLTLFAAQSIDDEIKCLQLLHDVCNSKGEPFHIFPLSPLIDEHEVLASQKP